MEEGTLWPSYTFDISDKVKVRQILATYHHVKTFVPITRIRIRHWLIKGGTRIVGVIPTIVFNYKSVKMGFNILESF